MIDLVFRSVSRVRWLAWAATKGIYDAGGEVVNGYSVDEIGRLEISPGVFDSWWLVHLRMSVDKAGGDVDTLYAGEIEEGIMFTKSRLAAFVRASSLPVIFNGWRTYQIGLTTDRIQLIDSRDYVRKREYMGGMSF